MADGRPKIKLVHVTASPMTQWWFLRGQNPYMIGKGLEVHAVCSDGPHLQKMAQRDGIIPHPLYISRRIAPLSDFVSLVKLYLFFRRQRPQIVHLSTSKGSLLGALAAWAARVPVRIYHIRGLASESAAGAKRKLYQRLERLTAQLCQQSIVNAFSLLDYARAAGILAPDQGKVFLHGMANGIDARRFDPDAVQPADIYAARPAARPDSQAVVIGYLGRITHDKGIDHLAEAWRQIREEFPRARLLMVGQWEREDAVSPENRTALEADPQVIIFGHQDDVVPFYRAMDLFVYPSHGGEGFPNGPMEAAAMRLPVIVTRVLGSVDAVIDGQTGMIVPPRDSGALADALRTYLRDPELRRRHGDAGRQRVERDFRQEAIWECLFQEYARLLAARGLPAPSPA